MVNYSEHVFLMNIILFGTCDSESCNYVRARVYLDLFNSFSKFTNSLFASLSLSFILFVWNSMYTRLR